jgi:ATP-dependent Clp protease ATP-binding subunit ClpC
LKDFGTGVGFATGTKTDNADEHSKGVIENALKKAFAPEFLNRIDDVVVFNSLNREDIHKIIDIELEKLQSRITTMGYTIDITQKAKDFIVDKGFDANYGARPLKRAIQKFIEDPLAEEMIKSGITEGDLITIGFDEEKKEISITAGKPKVKKDKKSDKKEE